MDTYVTVLDQNTDAVLHRFGPFQNAAAARVAAAAKAGRMLTWRKDGDLWRADLAPLGYLVVADLPVGPE